MPTAGLQRWAIHMQNIRVHAEETCTMFIPGAVNQYCIDSQQRMHYLPQHRQEQAFCFLEKFNKVI